MKRKLVALMLVLCFALGAFGLVACDDDKADYTELAIGVKYYASGWYLRSENEYEKTYVAFAKNNTGVFHYYDEDFYYDRVAEYTIKFKYTYVDEDKSVVVCFYDGVELGRYNTATLPNSISRWTGTFTVSQNVLMAGCTVISIPDYFINANYLNKELTNYYQSDED